MTPSWVYAWEIGAPLLCAGITVLILRRRHRKLGRRKLLDR